MAKLADFMISKVRVKLLQILLETPGEMFYVRELTRKSSEEINAVRRELSRLQGIGMVKSEKRGNRLYYQYNQSYEFFLELLSLVVKTTGIGRQIIKNKSKLGFIRHAFISTAFVRGIERDKDQVDLVFIGQVIMPQIRLLISGFEAKTKKEINYSIMTEDEFKFRKSRRDPFILSILFQPRIMLIGDELRLV